MSPMMMALIGVLAFKALKGLTGGQRSAPPPSGGPQPSGGPPPGGTATADAPGGGLGDILGGLLGGKPGTSGGTTTASAPGGGLGDILGGLFGGKAAPGGGAPSGSAGAVLSGGLSNLIRDLQNAGQGRAAQSWVGSGPNEEIHPNDLGKALGADTVSALSARTGLPREQLLEGLSNQLPELVNQLTPKGRLPTEQEASRW
jgi:uncharacterized protein YidB (DUF937 family)